MTENEYKEGIKYLTEKLEICKDEINRQKAEIERLGVGYKRLGEITSAGAISIMKEFAKLLIEKHSYPHPNILKERIVYVSDIQEIVGEEE